MVIKIFSQNVNGIRDFVKRRKIFSYFKQKSVDILCLQETHSSPQDEKFWKNEWKGHALFSHGKSNSKGVAIFFRDNLDYQILNVCKDIDGRYIVCHLKINGKEIVLNCIYGPNVDSPEFFVELWTILENSSNPEWIVAGDFNVVLNFQIDVKNSKEHANKRAAQVVKEYMSQHDMIDIWRENNPCTKRFSYQRNSNTASRLDYFLVSRSLFAHVKKVEILPSILSDHSALSLNIE